MNKQILVIFLFVFTFSGCSSETVEEKAKSYALSELGKKESDFEKIITSCNTKKSNFHTYDFCSIEFWENPNYATIHFSITYEDGEVDNTNIVK